MKFTTPILFSTIASASILERGINLFVKRDDIPASITVSRDPLPNASGLDTVINSLQAIQDLTINSTYTIGNFSGELNDALAIQTATGVLNDATYNATLACAQIGNLSVSDSEALGAFTQGLAYAVNASIATLISKKPLFEKLGIAQLVVGSLQSLMAGSYAFSATVLQKVPPELQIVSAALSTQVGESIGEGIQCFNGTASACITTIANPDRTRLQAILNDTINDGSSIRATGFTALIVAIFATLLAF